jgi:hypothetical protein
MHAHFDGSYWSSRLVHEKKMAHSPAARSNAVTVQSGIL